MNMAPPVSIIIPVYNGQLFIRQLCKNLVYYHDRGCEIILVENGTKQGVEPEINATLPHAKYFWTEKANVSYARNLGAAHATGDFLQFLDVDDTLEPGKLECQSQFAFDNKLDLVYSDWRFVYHDGEEITYSEWHDSSKEFILGLLLGEGWHPIHSYLWSRAIFEQLRGFDTSFKVAHEDANLLMHFLLKYNIGYCPGRFTNHHKYANHKSLSSSRGVKYWKDNKRFWLNHLELLNSSTHKGIKDQLPDKLFNITRNLAKWDMKEAIHLLKIIHDNFPDFQPIRESLLFRYVYKAMGYRFAEHLAITIDRISRRTNH